MKCKRKYEYILIGIVGIFILFVWECPIERLTGIPCPGCMMTTALYYLVQFDFKRAFYYNPAIYLLLVMSIPLFVMYHKNRKLMNRWLIITLLIWFMIYVYRMCTIFPEFPMQYVEENVLNQIFKCFK